MKRKTFSILAAILMCGSMLSQTIPDFGIVSPIKINLKSGTNQIIIPQVSDGDIGTTQNITFSATSSDITIAEVISVDYSIGNTIAVLNIKEKNKFGAATISIKATDIDGDFSRDISINVGAYDYPGIKFEIHDIVFWREQIPLDGTPVWDTIIQTGEGPWSKLNWANIPITVNSDCKTSPPCMGHDFFTAMFRGYIIPSVSGDYTFYRQNQDGLDLWLSSNDKHVPSTRIIFKSKDATKNIGTDLGSGEFKSAPVTLEAGKVYAIHGCNWIVHTMSGGIMWEAASAGIAKQYIPGANMMPVYDTIRPVAVKNLILTAKSSSELLVAWDKTSDNVKVSGYNIYIDGIKANTELINTAQYKFDGLDTETQYNIIVTALDAMGNESLISNILSATTYPADAVAPVAPSDVNLILATGEAMKIKWSGAVDNETAVIAYDVYVNDVKYNSSYLYADSLIIYGLKPLTNYKIEVVALDASYNASAKSSPENFKTAAFDPSGVSLGEKRARMKIEIENISWTEGIGINGPYNDYSMFDNPSIKKLVDDMQPGALRWGTLSANHDSLKGCSGLGKEKTYARMMNEANKLGAWFTVSTGMDNTDFFEDSTTFLHFIEYLAGPSTSTWGAVRASEGFTEPLLKDSKGLLIEFGCEPWGGPGLHNSTIGTNYDLYGKWCRAVARLIKTSPYYDPKKIVLAYSGRNPHPTDSYGLNRLAMKGDTGEIECLSVSGYMGGNLSYDPAIPQGESENDYYKNVLAKFAYNIEGLKLTMSEDMLKYTTGGIKTFYMYETNTTTDAYNGRLGQAILCTDYMVTSMKYGSIVPSVFHLTGGIWKIIKPSEGYKPLGLYLTSQLFNKYAKGHILRTTIETNDVVTDPASKKINFEPVGAHAFCDSTNYAIVLFSRDFENDYSVQIDLPNAFNFTSSAKMYTITGSDFSTFDAVLDSSNISINDSLLVKVPKYSMVLIRFTGDNKNLKQLPLGYFSFVKATAVEAKLITATTAEITTNKGEIKLTHAFTPANVDFNKVNWSILSNPINATMFVSGNEVTIRASGKSTGNGIITLKVTAIENPEIFDTISIVVSGQGVSSIVNSISSVSAYPNPVDEYVNIESTDGPIQQIDIFSLTGMMVYSKICSEPTIQLSVNNLDNGIYFIQIKTEKGKHTLKIIKQ